MTEKLKESFVGALMCVVIGAGVYQIASKTSGQPWQPILIPTSAYAGYTPILTVYSQPNCGPCATLKKTLAEPAVKAVLSHWKVHPINDPSEAHAAGVTGFPTAVATLEKPPSIIHLGRFEGAKNTGELLAWLALLPGLPPRFYGKDEVREAGASIGGPTAPDGTTEVACDLPADLHRKNTASKGLGNCVFTSLHHSAIWQNVPQLQEFPKWLIHQGIPGGGYPSKVEKLIPEISRDRGLPTPDFFQVSGVTPAIMKEVLLAACRSGRMPAITYSHSPTGRYGGSRIAHMTSLVHADQNWLAVLDNNYMPRDPPSGIVDNLEWMNWDEAHTAGILEWCVVLKNPPPPPPPRNQEK